MKAIEKFLAAHPSMTLEISCRRSKWTAKIVETSEGSSGTETYPFSTVTADSLTIAIVKLAVHLS